MFNLTIDSKLLGCDVVAIREDWNAGHGLAGAVRAFGGICAQRLGMKPQQS
jgi:hypothetical protein